MTLDELIGRLEGLRGRVGGDRRVVVTDGYGEYDVSPGDAVWWDDGSGSGECPAVVIDLTAAVEVGGE